MTASLLAAPRLALRIARRVTRRASSGLRDARTYLRRSKTPALIKQYDKLHLGSGSRLLDGWANLDISGLGSLVWDLRQPLPLARGHVRFVYTEHFLEHVQREDALRLLTHARNVMAPGGVVRISTPNLKRLIDDYQAGRLVHAEHGGWRPETPCRMVNEAMHWWGHVFLYDEPELRTLLEECGFVNIRPAEWGKSQYPELRELESRPYFDDLIFEAEVPGDKNSKAGPRSTV